MKRRYAERPWHFWPVAAIALLWNGALVAGYLARHFWGPRVDTSDLLPEVLPLWIEAFWVLGIGAGLFGAVLLAARVAGSAVTLALSFLALAVAVLAVVLLPAGISEPRIIAVLVGSVAFSVAIWCYAREQKQLGVLD